MFTYNSKQNIDESAPIVVAGAGLAGCLISLMLAQRGEQVVVFEKRKDPRQADTEAGRSINLALSERGLNALRQVGLAEDILGECLPMYGRILHDGSSRISRQAYGPRREHINSVSRSSLNERLLDAADKHELVTFRFEHPIEELDLTDNKIIYRSPETNRKRTQAASLVIAADGAFSAVREACRKTPRFDYGQSFLSHGYKELTIPADADGAHKIAKDGLHIWPRHDFMLIALPNLDGSFTATLFLPWEGEHSFAALEADGEVTAFFQKEFPDAARLIPELEQEFHVNPTGTMVTIDCDPFHFGGGVALIGDAAHAIVPFYGQGMNAAFEDCVVFMELFDDMGDRRREMLKEYSRRRIPNARAIRDLALQNFEEMQSDVANPLFRLRKKVEHAAERMFPERFRSLYSMISFSNIPYADAVQRAERQSQMATGALAGTAASAATALLALKGRNNQSGR